MLFEVLLSLRLDPETIKIMVNLEEDVDIPGAFSDFTSANPELA